MSIDDAKDKIITLSERLKRYFSAAKGLYVETMPVSLYLTVLLLVAVLVAWLLWPVRIDPTPEFTRQQTEAKEEIKKDAQEGEKLTQEASQVEQKAKSASERTQTLKKGIVEKKNYAKHKQTEADNAGATGRDGVTVRDYTDLCARANSLHVRCDIDK